MVPENELFMPNQKEIKFPTVLRKFYADWGKHKELTSTIDLILHPSECFLQSGYLVFAIENQSVFFWGIDIKVVNYDDPPVYFAYNEDNIDDWNLSHDSISDFLDGITFGHAFADLYAHGAYTWNDLPTNFHDILMKNGFKRTNINSHMWGLRIELASKPWGIYHKEGVILNPFSGLAIKAKSQEEVWHIANLLKVKWEKAW